MTAESPKKRAVRRHAFRMALNEQELAILDDLSERFGCSTRQETMRYLLRRTDDGLDDGFDDGT